MNKFEFAAIMFVLVGNIVETMHRAKIYECVQLDFDNCSFEGRAIEGSVMHADDCDCVYCSNPYPNEEAFSDNLITCIKALLLHLAENEVSRHHVYLIADHFELSITSNDIAPDDDWIADGYQIK